MNYKKIMELMISHLDEGIIVVDSNLKIKYFNEPSINITGFEPREAIGKDIYQVFPNINKDNSTFYKVINNGRPIIDYVQNYVNCKGKNVSIVTSTIPIVTERKLKVLLKSLKT